MYELPFSFFMPEQFFYYHAYGLVIRSSILLTGFKSNLSSSEFELQNYDLTIRVGFFEKIPLNSHEYIIFDNFKIVMASNQINVYWKDKILFAIINDNEIILNKLTGLSDDFLSLTILGFAVPILLHRRGMLVLHANAIEINGEAIIFLGQKGVGKSTTSLALCKKGYNLISDDVLMVQVGDSISNVFSGFNIIKIWPETIRQMGENPDKLPKIHSNISKRFYSVSNNDKMDRIPIKIIYFITEGNKTTIEKLPPQMSLINLIESTLWSIIFDNEELEDNLKKCAKLVKNVPVKCLRIKRSLKDIPNMIKVIEDDIENL